MTCARFGIRIAIAMIAGCAGDRAFASEAEVGAVHGLRERLVEAANAGDAGAAAALFAEDAVLIRPGAPALVGRRAIAKWWASASSEMPSSTTRVESFEVLALGEWALDRGVYTTVFHSGGEAERRSNGSYLHLLRREDDGTWKVARAMWNHLPSLVVEDIPRLPR